MLAKTSAAGCAISFVRRPVPSSSCSVTPRGSYKASLSTSRQRLADSGTVKDIIIELLSYVPAELLSDAVDELLKESGLTVKIRLENSAYIAVKRSNYI